nr:hypothetical protein [Tanacetum cinerariifolium]
MGPDASSSNHLKRTHDQTQATLFTVEEASFLKSVGVNAFQDAHAELHLDVGNIAVPLTTESWSDPFLAIHVRKVFYVMSFLTNLCLVVDKAAEDVRYQSSGSLETCTLAFMMSLYLMVGYEHAAMNLRDIWKQVPSPPSLSVLD